MRSRSVLTVSLTPELERFIDGTVASGLYGSASEVVREGLRLLRERQQMSQAAVAEARAAGVRRHSARRKNRGKDSE